MAESRVQTYGAIWNANARTRGNVFIAHTLADVIRLFRAGQCAECGALSTDGVSLYSHGVRFVQHHNGALVYSTEYYPRSWYWHGGTRTNIRVPHRGDTLRRHMRMIRATFGDLPAYTEDGSN